jgi:hypothetical protein
MFRAAHEALGLLDVGAEEAEMTEGQLRARKKTCGLLADIHGAPKRNLQLARQKRFCTRRSNQQEDRCLHGEDCQQNNQPRLPPFSQSVHRSRTEAPSGRRRKIFAESAANW